MGDRIPLAKLRAFLARKINRWGLTPQDVVNKGPDPNNTMKYLDPFRIGNKVSDTRT